MNIEELSISQYIVKRINNNINIHSNLIFENNYIHEIDNNIFHLFYFLLTRYLNEGHTVLLISNSNWLEEMINITLSYFDNVISYSSILEFSDELYKSRKNQEKINIIMKDLEFNFKNSLYNKINKDSDKKNSTEIKNIIDEYYIIYLSLLRFYYLSFYILKDSLKNFIDRLKNNCFFSVNCQKNDRVIIVNYKEKEDKAIIWLNRIYHAEKLLFNEIKNLCQSESKFNDIQRSLTEELNKEQIEAIENICNHSISIITGGPGTGKTFTIAQMVRMIYDKNPNIHLALVAPTGKAGQRMKESLQNAIKENDISLPEPMTIHRLLGIGNNGMPYYHKNNPLSYEIIIIDEASMLGIELAKDLLMAIKPKSKIILLGDTHQLSAVDAGSVLSDLCKLDILKNNQTNLIQSKRFNNESGIGKLAHLINQKEFIDIDFFQNIISTSSDLFFKDINSDNDKSFYDDLLKPYYDGENSYFYLTKQIKNTFFQMDEEQQKNYLTLLNKSLNQYRILTASHSFICGDRSINHYIKIAHRDYLELAPEFSRFSWYHGRPVMVLKNRYDLGLFNGDIGICLQNGRKSNQLAVYFYEKSLKIFPIHMFDDDIIESSYAITIHKSQGSEFDTVAITFNDDNQRILSKELIYTAITRAKKQVKIYSTKSALKKSINTETKRYTGLKEFERIGDCGIIDN